MKVLAYNGSPRLRANTETLVTEVLRGAEAAGATVDLRRLNDLTISPCQACNTCKRTGACRLADDMTAQYEALRAADVVVLGTPIYWWGPSAQMKAFFDRWYALQHLGVMAGKSLLLVCTYGDSGPDTARFTVGMLETAARYLGMRFLPPLVVSTPEPGSAAANGAALEQARRAGAALVGRGEG